MAIYLVTMAAGPCRWLHIRYILAAGVYIFSYTWLQVGTYLITPWLQMATYLLHPGCKLHI